MIDVRDEAKLGLPAAPHVTVLNPLTVERSHLRVTLLPSLIETARPTCASSSESPSSRSAGCTCRSRNEELPLSRGASRPCWLARAKAVRG